MKKIAIVVGHKKTSQGASNKKSGMTEWKYNNSLAKKIKAKLANKNLEVVIMQRVTSYSALPGQVNKENPDLILSLHCNAFNKRASGCEMLYYHSSKNSKRFAKKLQKNMLIALGSKDRGTKPKHSEDRGAHILKNTLAPCVIAEPFFIDNNSDLNNAESKEDAVVKAYSNAIISYIG